MRKVRIRTILGFCCANLGSELCAIILGSRTQTPDPRISCANLGSARNHLGSRNQTPAIRGNKPTIGRARKAAQPSAATWVRCSGWPSCFACAIDRGFFAADGRGSVARSQKIACGSEVCAAKSCFVCAIDRGFVAADGRGLAARSQKIACGSEVCMRDPRIIAQKLGS